MVKTRTVKCPTCGDPVEWRPENPWRPFCSERCRLIDLGAWFEEEHAIPVDPAADGNESDPGSR